MTMRLILIVLLALALGQHHDPFAGSGCDCDRFCRNECAINNTASPIQMTVYRMTMKGVYDLRDKDTGDAAGDTSFVISKKNNAWYCRQNPNDFDCKDLAQFSGDDLNSTDKILEMKLTVDGQWGPYLECNPINGSVPAGLWSCENGINMPAPPGYPKQCTAAGYHGNMGYCANGLSSHTLTGSTQGDCCDYMTQAGAGVYRAYNYFPNNKTCVLFKDYHWGDNVPCEKAATMGFYYPPDPNKCECERIYKTVGRQNQTQHGGSYSIAGGLWFSHPAGGECKGSQTVGDGSGCTYAVQSISRAINATCMYKALDTAVEAMNASCFSRCTRPYNVTSDCYLSCYSDTTAQADKANLVKPWINAFASDGCPEVDIHG